MKQLPTDQFVLPDYGAGRDAGRTIANIPATIAELMGVSFEGLPPLPADLWRSLTADGSVKRVVLLTIDGMGRQFMRDVAAAFAPLQDQLVVDGTITSVFPSTTVNALSSLWTGRAPAAHGLVGIRMLMPNLGTIGHMIHFSPGFTRLDNGLVDAGVEPEKFLAVPGMAEQLSAAGVACYSIKNYKMADSALSRMHTRGCTADLPCVGLADMLWQIRSLLQTAGEQPTYIMGYWEEVDTASHGYTPYHPAVGELVQSVVAQIETHLLAPLRTAGDDETVVLITADHGQIAIEDEKRIFLNDHPALKEMTLIEGGGELRMPYLYAQQGRMDEMVHYIEQHLGDLMVPVTAADALTAGWLGPEPYAPQVRHRLGDVIGMMRPGATWVVDMEAPILERVRGVHGGLTEDEMLVPFLAIRPGR